MRTRSNDTSPSVRHAMVAEHWILPVGLLTNRSRACNYLSFRSVEVCILSENFHLFSIRVMVSRKQHLKRISALAADGKRVAKRARQSQNRRASSSPSNSWIIPTKTIQLTILNHHRNLEASFRLFNNQYRRSIGQIA